MESVTYSFQCAYSPTLSAPKLGYVHENVAGDCAYGFLFGQDSQPMDGNGHRFSCRVGGAGNSGRPRRNPRTAFSRSRQLVRRRLEERDCTTALGPNAAAHLHPSLGNIWGTSHVSMTGKPKHQAADINGSFKIGPRSRLRMLHAYHPFHTSTLSPCPH